MCLQTPAFPPFLLPMCAVSILGIWGISHLLITNFCPSPAVPNALVQACHSDLPISLLLLLQRRILCLSNRSPLNILVLTDILPLVDILALLRHRLLPIVILDDQVECVDVTGEVAEDRKTDVDAVLSVSLLLVLLQLKCMKLTGSWRGSRR